MTIIFVLGSVCRDVLGAFAGAAETEREARASVGGGQTLGTIALLIVIASNRVLRLERKTCTVCAV